MYPRIAIACVLAALAASAAGPKLVEDPPLLRAPKDGNISGVIRPAAQVAKLQAVSRVTKQTYAPTELDKASGKFLFTLLPGDATYDLCVTTADGRTIEGIDLEMADARLARLAEVRRKDLLLPPPPAHPFTAEDANAILQYVAKTEDFMDIRRMLYLRGHGTRAAALVELLRTKEYYAAKPGELIWRVELWYFQFNHGDWERIPDTERVLRRERTPHDKWAQIDLQYDPALSVFIDPNGTSPAVDFSIPDKADPSRGRPKNTKPELDTPPHVTGLDEKPEPASQPDATSKPAK
jgi:hypothetical protein